MKSSLSLFIIILLLFPSSISAGNNLQNCKVESYQHGLHLTLSGPRIWTVVKFNFSKYTALERRISCRCSLNDSSLGFIAEVFQGESAPSGYTVMSPTIANPGRYFEIGPLHRLHFHIRHIKSWNCWTDFFACIYPSNMTQYYIFISYTNYSYYDIRLNWTGNATVSIANGSDVFAYERHDFTGNLNIGRRRGTVILNGQMDITVNHTLFAWYDVSNTLTGREVLRYTNPNGDEAWESYRDQRGNHIAWNDTARFDENLLWGPSGAWKFSVNMFNRGLKRQTPNIFLFGADVQLPD